MNMNDESQDIEKTTGGTEAEDTQPTIVEAQIINQILDSASTSILTRNGIDRSYFPGYDLELGFILDHQMKYGVVPDITTFLNKFPDFPVFELKEAEKAMVFAIKEAMGYSLIAPALKEVDEVAKKDSIEAAKLMKLKSEEILATVSVSRFSKGIDLFKDAEDRYQEYLRRMAMRGKLGNVFNIKSFDEATGGVWETDFLAIEARPGEGKSWIMEYFLLQPWLIQKKKILLFSLENPKEVVGFRADSLLRHFSNFGLMTGRDILAWDENRPAMTYEHYKNWIDEAKNSDVAFEVLDIGDSITGSFTIEEMLEIADAKGADIVGIDQLSLIGTERQFKTIREGYIHTTRTIRKAVNERHKPIYLNCQASREAAKQNVKNKEATPEIGHIAESDSVGQDATKILSLKQLEGMLKITLIKNTLGISNLSTLMKWNIDLGILEPISLEDLKSPTDRF